MAETWLYENPPEGALLSFDEVVRVELGPQVIEMQCSTKNLSRLVTHPKYRVGKPDAVGTIIGGPDLPVDAGKTMRVVDWRAYHVPKLWKVYRWQDVRVSPTQFQKSWVKIDQFENFDDAVELARHMRKEMSSDAIHN